MARRLKDRVAELSEEEKEAWDAFEWDEDGTIPQEISSEELNKFLFNADTVDKALATLMEFELPPYTALMHLTRSLDKVDR